MYLFLCNDYYLVYNCIDYARSSSIMARSACNASCLHHVDVNMMHHKVTAPLNWAARNQYSCNDHYTRINTHFLNQKYIYHQLLGYLGLNYNKSCTKRVNSPFILRFATMYACIKSLYTYVL